MKILGSHNTKSKPLNLKHLVAKLFLDRANGSLCINHRLLGLLGIEKKEDAYVFFIEDDNGAFGICKTDDKEKGIPLYWYKSDTRARMFNSTIVEYLMKKFNLKDTANSYHFVFYQIPEKVGKYQVFQIKETFPYLRRMIN